MRRREFIKDAVATLYSESLPAEAWVVSGRKGTGINLIPSAPSQAPNYWCTWRAQNYMYGHDLQHLDPKVLEGKSGAGLAEKELTEQTIFGPDVLAQDLRGGKCADITSRVEIHGREMRIRGELISSIGLSHATSGDLSDPGAVLGVA